MTKSDFAGVFGGMWWVFVSVGVVIPLLPPYVTGPIGEGTDYVGLTVLLYAVAGVLARPVAGIYLRAGNPWHLMLGAAVIGSVALVATPLVVSSTWMLACRMVEGFALGCFYPAAATRAIQLGDTNRRGSTLSYLSVPLFLGVALGPAIGDALIDAMGLRWSWVAGGGLLALAIPSACLGWAADTGEWRRRTGVAPKVSLRDVLWTIAHPAAVLPGAVLMLIVAGWSAFQAYVPLYAPTLGASDTGWVFFAYSVIVLVIRVGGASLFDRLPLVELVIAGAIAHTAGIAMVWCWHAMPALYLGAVLMGAAIGLAYTSLLSIALSSVAVHEHGAVIGAYSLAYDIGVGVGAAGLGFLGAWTGTYAVIFAGGAVCGVLAMLLTFARLWPQRRSHRPQLGPLAIRPQSRP